MGDYKVNCVRVTGSDCSAIETLHTSQTQPYIRVTITTSIMTLWKNQMTMANYMKALFEWHVTPNTQLMPVVPEDMRVQLGCDCAHVAIVAAQALLNPGK